MFLNWREMNPDKTVNLNGRTGGVKWLRKVSSYRTELKCTVLYRNRFKRNGICQASLLLCNLCSSAHNSKHFFSLLNACFS